MSKKKIVLGKSFESLLEDKADNDSTGLLEESFEAEESEELYFGEQDKETEIDDEQEAVEVKLIPEEDEESEEGMEDNCPDKAVKTIVIEDIDILSSFIQEAGEHLDNIEEKIIRLESGKDTGVVDDIFRSMHTLKGNAAFFGFEKIKELSHSLESILDEIRGGRVDISPELIDILLEGTDLLGGMTGELEVSVRANKGEEMPVEIPDTEVDIGPVMSRIRMLNKAEEKDERKEKEKKEKKEIVVEDLINKEMIEKFLAEAEDLIDSAEKDVLELENSPDNRELLDNVFRAVHTIKGNAGFLGYSKFEERCMKMETVMDSLRSGEKGINQGVVTLLLKSLDSMREVFVSIQSEKKGTETAGEEGPEEYKPIGELLVEMGESTPEMVDEALELQDKKVGEILVARGQVSDDALKKALKKQEEASGRVPGAGGAVERKDIRVDMRKLDKLFNLVGELITAEEMVIHSPELEGMELESFKRAAGYLNKITREMQEITMTVRMVPLDGLFNKMKRLVRDLSRKFNREIKFELSGQDTEMDRNVIEEISDPLVHIIRNAIDHGIEDAQTRKTKGKEETGSINLGAKYEGNEIWITIKDDGAGLNREKILGKAKEKGLLKTDAKSMKDEEVWPLIFEAGFSTAEKVSEISGRGVGMDVVRRNIEKLRGKIDIKSAAGEGSEIILKIPLTMAIIDGITVKVGKVLYALPLGDILEFHKADKSQITVTDINREVIKLREDIIPVIKLHEFFNMETDKTETTAGILIIIHSNSIKAGLLVDEITGYQQIVVKALPKVLGNMRAVSGCSILGNGEVSLIIDTGSLLKEELG